MPNQLPPISALTYQKEEKPTAEALPPIGSLEYAQPPPEEDAYPKHGGPGITGIPRPLFAAPGKPRTYEPDTDVGWGVLLPHPSTWKGNAPSPGEMPPPDIGTGESTIMLPGPPEPPPKPVRDLGSEANAAPIIASRVKNTPPPDLSGRPVSATDTLLTKSVPELEKVLPPEVKRKLNAARQANAQAVVVAKRGQELIDLQQQMFAPLADQEAWRNQIYQKRYADLTAPEPPPPQVTAGSYWSQQAAPFIAAVAPGSKGLPGPAGFIEPALGLASNLMKAGGIDPTSGLPLNQPMTIPNQPVRPGVSLFQGIPTGQPLQLETSTPQALSEIPEKGISAYGLEESARGYPAAVTGARAGLLGVLDMLGSPENAAIIYGTGGALKLIRSELGAKAAEAVGKLITSKFGYDIGKNLATERVQQIGESIANKDTKGLVEGLVGGAVDVGFLVGGPRSMIPETARGLKSGIDVVTKPRIETATNTRLVEEGKAQDQATLERVGGRLQEIERLLADPNTPGKDKLLEERENAREALRVVQGQVAEGRQTFGTEKEAVDYANRFQQGARVERLPDGRWGVAPTPATEGGVKTPPIAVVGSEEQKKEEPAPEQPLPQVETLKYGPPELPKEVAPVEPPEAAPLPPEAPKEAPKVPEELPPAVQPGTETVRGGAPEPIKARELTPEDLKAKVEFDAKLPEAMPNLGPDQINFAREEFFPKAAAYWQRQNPGRTTAEFYRDVVPTYAFKEKKTASGEAFLQSDEALAHPVFFSAAERAIEQKMPKSASPQQVRGILSPQNGVKPDELAWIGLDHFLEGKETVSRDGLLNFVREHNVKVETTVRGGEPDEKLADRLAAAGNESAVRFSDLLTMARWLVGGGTTAMAGIESRARDGANFRETRPRRRSEILDIVRRSTGGAPTPEEAQVDAALGKYWDAVGAEQTALSDYRRAKGPEPKYSQYSLPGGEEYREVLLRLPSEKGRPDFTESHWEEPNVAVHLRLKTRKDADGKKTLFFEEVQSDWGQKGRERGYMKREAREIPGTGKYAVFDENDRVLARFDNIAVAAFALRSGQVPGGDYYAVDPNYTEGGSSTGPVPDMPFKKTWPLVAFKWALRYASEHGYDRISWTTGAQQAQRYSLGTVVDQINWSPVAREGARSVVVHAKNQRPTMVAVDPDGIMTSGRTELNGKRLDEAVGKDLAKRIMSEERGEVEAKDLVIGGEGMKGFYDQILPAEIGKYVKKWGGQVGKAEIETKPGGFVRLGRLTPEVRDALRKEEYLGFDNEVEAVAAISRHPDWKTRWDVSPETADVVQRYLDAGKRDPGVTEPVHSLDITPQMREQALGGQPLFQKGPIPASTKEIPADFAQYATEIKAKGKAFLKSARKAVDIIGDRDVQEYVAAAMAGRAQKGWYERSTKAVREVFGKDADQFLSLVAALSPRQQVPPNLRMAVTVWEAWVKRGRPTDEAQIRKMFPKVYGDKFALVEMETRVNNAVRALSDPNATLLEGKTLSGLKVESFRRNLLGDPNAIANDTWMARFGEMNEKLFGEPVGYAAASYLVRKAAKKLGWAPAEVQETVWSFYQTLYESTMRGEGKERVGAVSSREALERMTHGDIVENAKDFAQLLTEPEVQSRLKALGYTGEPSPRGRLVGANRRENVLGEDAGRDRVLGRIARRTQKAFDESVAKEELNRMSEDEIRSLGVPELDAYRKDLGLVTPRLTRDTKVADLLREKSLVAGASDKMRRIATEFVAPGWLQKMSAKDRETYTHDVLDSVDIDGLVRAAGLEPGQIRVNKGYYDGYSNPAPHIDIEVPKGVNNFQLLPRAKRLAAALGAIHDQESVSIIAARPARFERNSNAMHLVFEKPLSTEDIIKIGDALGTVEAWTSPREDGLVVGHFNPKAGDYVAWHKAVRDTVDKYGPKDAAYHYVLLDNAGMLVERKSYGTLLGTEGTPARPSDLSERVDRSRGEVAQVRQYYADKYGAESTEAGAAVRPREAPAEIEPLLQTGKGAKGAFFPGTELSPRAAVEFYKAHDFSTFLHEGAHFIESILSAEDATILKGAYGEGWRKIREQQERFARDLERYALKGEAPTPRLQEVFKKVVDWMREVYRSVKSSIFAEELPAETKAFWDRFFAEGEEAPIAGKVLEPSAPEKAELEKGEALEPETAGLLGSPYTGSMAQRRTMAPTPKTEPVSATDIIKHLEIITGTPIKIGHGDFGRRKAIGWFNPRLNLIREQTANDIDTAAHEVGHRIHYRDLGGKTAQLPLPVRKDLVALGKALYGPRVPPGGYGREGWAEYIRIRLTGGTTEVPEDIATIAPAAHAWFETTFLATRPKIRAELEKARENYERYDLQGALSRIAGQIHRHGKFARVKEGVQDLVQRGFRTLFVTDAAPLERAFGRLLKENPSIDLPPEKNPVLTRAALLMNARGSARSAITEGTVGHAAEKTGDSLRDALLPVKDDLENFVLFAVAKRAVDLHGRGIDPGFALRDAEYAVSTLGSPAFEKAAKDVTDWSQRLIDYVVVAGGLSPADAAIIRTLNPIYVPFKRYFDESYLGGSSGLGGARGSVNQPTALKKIKGSGRPIIDPLEALVQQAEHMYTIGNKLRVGKAIVEAAEAMPGSGWFANKVPAPKAATTFTVADIAKDLKEAGIDLAGADPEQILTVFQNTSRYFGKDNIVAIWRNGKREFWEVDPDIYRVVTDMDKDIVLPWILSAPKRGVQLGATGLSPAFSLISNPVRDSLTWTLYAASRHFSPLGVVRGFKHELFSDPVAQRYRRAGLDFGTIMGQDRMAAKRTLEEALANDFKDKAWITAKHPIDSLRGLFGAFESGPRLAEFEGVLKTAEAKYGAGSVSAFLEAAYKSKDVTVNFTRMGTVARAMNQMIPFFNARIQGASKFFRVLGGSDGRSAQMRALGFGFAYITMPSLLLWYLNKDEKWYQELPAWQKGAFWVWSPDGGRTKYRLPKPMELGYLFGSVPEAIADWAYRKNKRGFSDAAWGFVDQLLPFSISQGLGAFVDVLPAVVKPAVEVATNYDAFRNQQLTEDWIRKQRLPEDQKRRYTSQFAQDLSKLFNVSVEKLGLDVRSTPTDVEHLVSGYSGGLSLSIAQAFDLLSGHSKKKGDEGLASAPVVSRLALRSGTGASVDDLYKRATVLEQKHGSKKISPDEEKELKVLLRAKKDLAEVRHEVDLGKSDQADANYAMTEIARKALLHSPPGTSHARPLGRLSPPPRDLFRPKEPAKRWPGR